MVKQTISKEEAEHQISERLKQKHPAASAVSLIRTQGDRWQISLDGHDVDKAMASDADSLLHDILQKCDVSEMPTGAVSVDNLNTGNDN